jgi:hypothetical protein
MSDKTLPEKYRVRTRQELEELASSNEPTKRGVLGALLRELGFEPATVLEMKSKERVELILKTQAERGGGGDATKEAPEPTKGKAGGAAAPAGAAKEKAGGAAAPAGGGAAVGGGSSAALEKKIVELQATILEQGKAIAALTVLMRDTHYLTRLLVMSDGDTNANSKDPEVRELIFGKLSDEGNG